MGDLLRQGSQWLEQQRIAHCSSQVAYRHGHLELSVNATFGSTQAEVEDGYGMTMTMQVVDFLINADELGFEPAKGDVIVAMGTAYEVLPIGNEDCWRWSDRYRTRFRIHTKDVGDAD